ncbi:MAG: hydrogenase maturation nickel metallochaperone HypA [Nocardioidaceae bacterium]
MHELSLCSSIAGIVERGREGRTVTTVHLQVGQLRQVVPETLCFCWGVVTEDTPLAGSVLEIDHIPVVLDCRACGATTTVAEVLVLTCGDCGSGDIAVVTGEELMVTALDVGPTTAGANGERNGNG